MSEAEWRRVISVDLDAAVRLARACLPGMVQKGWGRIVNFAGMNAIHGHAGRTPMSVAKHGVWGLTKALAMEFGPEEHHGQRHLARPDRTGHRGEERLGAGPRPDRWAASRSAAWASRSRSPPRRGFAGVRRPAATSTAR